ncbi:MAG: DUF1592 domain-containing protein [Planctomycetota bacterium]
MACLFASVSLVSALKIHAGDASLATTAGGVVRFHAKWQGFFQNHCLDCHGEADAAEGEFAGIAGVDWLKDPEQMSRVVNVLRHGEMPPQDCEQPPQHDREAILADLKTLLQGTLNATSAAGHTPIRRMTRSQYNNAVIDLFDLQCVVFTLPEKMMRVHRGYFQPDSGKMPDVVTVGSRPLGKSQMIEPRLAGVAAFPQDLRAEHGYDNQADHLSLSPMLMESFLRLGQSVTHSPDFNAKRVGVWREVFASEETPENPRRWIRGRVAKMARRAFREAVDDATADRYTDFAHAVWRESGDLTEAMRVVAGAMIASPRFLYLFSEATQSNAPETLTEHELATRLALFLWGSIPDETLLELAGEGGLSDPSVLAAQVDRMLRDQRVKRFCDQFPTQWLQLDRIISSIPDREKFPSFYFSKYRNSMHMMLEPLLLFETVLIENRPITQLLDSPFTYRSGRLREAYGEKLSDEEGRVRGNDVTVLTFRRLPVEDRRYGGVVTNAAVMTMTSGPKRTQPITRGAWMASVLFRDPPEPPPADVPPLPEHDEEALSKMTLREQLAAHRERADCRGCHEQIDPLGFALENYNPVGRWRDRYANDRIVDMSGMLFGKHPFHDVIEFKDALLSEADRFREAFAGHLLTFAIARPLDAWDQSSVQRIAARAAKDGDGLKTLIREVVLSDAFRMKRNPPVESKPPVVATSSFRRSE